MSAVERIWANSIFAYTGRARDFAYGVSRRSARDSLTRILYHASMRSLNRTFREYTFSPPSPWRWLWPVLAGLAGSAALTAVYFALVAWAESLDHARDLFWQERALVLPLILGFGVQAALYTVLRLRLFVPVAKSGPAGAATGASGVTSTAAMIACCAHHVTDVLPVLGLTAAAAFLAEYQTAFMRLGLFTTLAGIGFMVVVLWRERRKALAHAAQCSPPAASALAEEC